MAIDESSKSDPLRAPLLLLAALAILGCAAIGGATNAVNGAVSPDYFRNIMGWHSLKDVWRASIAQGLFEGGLFGCVYALVFTATISFFSRGRYTFGFAFRSLLSFLSAISVCWAIGGFLGMGLAALSPEFYRNTFIGVPEAMGDMLRYAWVGGSIWGAVGGGVLTLPVAMFNFNRSWRDLHPVAMVVRA